MSDGRNLREEGLAEEAVSSELVSALNSLLYGKNTGNFADSAPFYKILSPIDRTNSTAPNQVPCEGEQGILMKPTAN
jgi:hypothetical protein